MKKALVMSSLMVAIAAAGLNAQETDGMDGQDDPMMDEQHQDDGMMDGQDDDSMLNGQDDDSMLNGQDDDAMMNGEEGEQDHAQIFMELDTDGDGVITREEAEQAEDYPELEEEFDDLDSDGDGVLTLEEFEEFELNGEGTW